MHRIVRHRQVVGSSRRRPWRLAMAAMLCAGAFAADVSARPLKSAKAEVRISFELRWGKRAPPADIIAGEYIVMFGNGIAGPLLQGNPQTAALAAKAVLSSEAAERRVEEYREGNVVLYRYRTAIIGFAARLSEGALADIGRIPGVRIEPNRLIAAPRDGAGDRSEIVAAPQAKMMKMVSAPPLPPPPFPKGLDRIDRRLPTAMDKAFQARFTGKDVHVYVIDTGVFASHDEFGSRVLAGYDATLGGQDTKDCRDHGTGVASVIGGRTLGVAPDVVIHPVRVFPCQNISSSIAVMTKGVDWVAADRVNNLAGKPVVVNVSFMTYASSLNMALNQAVTNSITLGGIPYVVAAGNGSPNLSPNGKGNISGVNACGVSPANVPAAITVGNIRPENDRIVKDSNYGPCIDLFAPGLDIRVAGSTAVKAIGPRDGTSFAAPHVTGVAALFLETTPGASPADVRAAILAASNNATTAGWPGISNRSPGASPNVLLHWGCGSNDGVGDSPLLPKAPVPPPCIGRK